MPLPLLELRDVGKTFVVHNQGGAELPVVAQVSFQVAAGECAVLAGPSGIGKSSILRMVFGNYACDHGAILITDDGTQIDVARATPRQVLALRRTAMSYVSQFLRVIPRVGALDIVAEAARAAGHAPEQALSRARTLLARLNVPERLWPLPPATFSGGEQQRVNVARGFASARPLLLLDEPTASLDAANRAVVVSLIKEHVSGGGAALGIFHDDDVRLAVAGRVIDVTRFAVTPLEAKAGQMVGEPA
jgi:alpha-D-ribose 1-methylphosphonate 5-triphosphate synthase subunit PhnL